ncbi:flagellar motility protein MotE (MotC chaperone) [Pelagimonas varians]|uniref:MgtE intracellular N domain protein n=2 Tax=Pelagimonas varians TaxID=696760 RepID=A0A238KAS9_9RHOB|nr:hypothetical protein [Pelagimonas varians]PYG31059.1 flagellar motility protein MotE (MotC chaperone) [Pelagimonas varians]SMX39554.1 hypothetical protein PEV8663_01756 [Pelagimonas varians]
MSQPIPPKQIKPKKRSKRKARGTLSAIGALLLASAALRIGIGANEALAREGAMIDTQAGPLSEAIEPAERNEPKPLGLKDDEIMPLLKAMNDREALISKREKSMAIRMQALSVAEQEIDRKMIALQAAEDQLRATMSLAQTAAEDDITNLTDVYANMKPKQAAALFEEMDPEFSAGFLARMRPDTAASILAGLSPSVAYTISVVLAGRNAEVPKQ